MMSAPTFKSSASAFKPPSGQLSILEMRDRATFAHARIVNVIYLAPGSIIDLQGGEVRISSLESTTHLVMLRVGARIGL